MNLFSIFMNQILADRVIPENITPDCASAKELHSGITTGVIMTARIEYTPNQPINGLIFLKEASPYVKPSGGKERKAKFKCYCGDEFESLIYSVTSKNTKSCGCLWRARIKEAKTTHGLHKHPLNHIWRGIKQRCSQPKQDNYIYYGARGIKICDEWRNDFKTFYDWAMADGWREGLQIDRIDNDDYYKPSNCRFVTPALNSRGRRNTKLTQEIVTKIRDMKSSTPEITQQKIANILGVGRRTVGNVLTYDTWRDE